MAHIGTEGGSGTPFDANVADDKLRQLVMETEALLQNSAMGPHATPIATSN